MKKPRLVKTELDQAIADLVARTDHKTLVIWSCECVERVLPSFERKYPHEQRPRHALEAAYAWVSTGVFRMADIRGASLAAHQAARAVEHDDVARSIAHGAGQAVATAHVAGHAIAAALYAATAVRDSVDAADASAAVAQEREWQYHRLRQLREQHG